MTCHDDQGEALPRTHTHSNVLLAVAEIGALERHLTQLNEIRRLAVELDHAPAAPRVRPTPSTAPRPRTGKRQSRPLQVADVLDIARELLADGPVSNDAILKAAGRTRTARGVQVTEAALKQLGAVAAGKVRGGGSAYALQAENGAPPPGLRDAVAELAKTAVGWSDEEFRYQLSKRRGMEVSLEDVHHARMELGGASA
jgi:hypothetical protein